MRKLMLATLSLSALVAAGSAEAQVKSWFEFKNPVKTIQEDPFIAGPDLMSAPVMNGPGGLAIGFEGISQYQNAANGRNFVPPDTMGAVGTTQFVELVNGGFAVYSKATGAQLQYKTDTAFWAAAGGQQTNGDPRIMFNATMNRWVALSFGAATGPSTLPNIQIAVSDTDDALGGWKSTVFTGYNGAGLFKPLADYPTMAMDANALYIGTNNFAATTAAGTQSWRGTTLNVIPLSDIFAAGGPSAANLKQFNNYYNTPGQTTNFAGFAIQGVNSKEASTTGNIFTVSATDYAVQRYDVLNAGTAGATLTAVQTLANGSYTGLCGGTNCAARQPGQAGTGSAATGLRNIDALDDRISSSVFEVNGRIYAVQTIMKAGNDHTHVRYYVIDSATNAILSQGEIGDNTYDYYQGSLAVNDKGQVVISYNRSGGVATGVDGRISIFAQAFGTKANGTLVKLGSPLLLKQSLTGGYLNGNTEASGSPSGRQRWGDYSSTTLDPLNQNKFWVLGQFAREANTPANGYPAGNGASRWGTYIAGVSFSELAGIPEPQSWIMMMFGFGLVGATLRRKQALQQVSA